MPRSADFLGLAKDTLYGVGHLSQAVVGAGTVVSGLSISATGPASLQVVIDVGSIYTQASVDATAYGSLGTDLNNIVKQGILAAPTTLTITPPATSGYSQVYLVEATYNDVDGGATVLPFFNSANPLVPYSGPSNSGSSQNTVRAGACVVALKAGIAAPTGSQTTPAADSGYVPLYAITVANGQTSITSANWAAAAASPVIPYNLITLPLRYGADTGTANALAITVPSVSALVAGQIYTIKKGASGVSGASTLNVNGLGAVSLVWADGSALANGDWPANVTGLVEYDGTRFNLQSPAGPTVFARTGPYLPLAGGTMTGYPLLLARDPVAPMEAVTLEYLQANYAHLDSTGRVQFSQLPGSDSSAINTVGTTSVSNAATTATTLIAYSGTDFFITPDNVTHANGIYIHFINAGTYLISNVMNWSLVTSGAANTKFVPGIFINGSGMIYLNEDTDYWVAGRSDGGTVLGTIALQVAAGAYIALGGMISADANFTLANIVSNSCQITRIA